MYPDQEAKTMTLIRDIGLATGDPFLIFKNMRQFECKIEGTEFDVYEFSLEEKMFDIFRAEVTIVHDRRFKSEDLLGKEVVSKIKGRVSDRLIHGKIREYEELPMKGRYHLFKVIVVSDLWILTQIRNLRIFQNITVPDIIREVFKTSRIYPEYYAIRLMGTYSPREYCVQYRETNLDFIKRLMAEEGMFFYHEFAKDRHIPVIVDSWMNHNKIPGHSDVVIYSKKGQLVTLEDHITEFEASERMTVENIHLSDYYFKQSAGPIQIKAACKDSVFFNIYDYPGYLLDDNRTCYQRVQVHLERETWKKKQFKGQGVCRQLLPGHVFSLADHANRDYNTDYIVTSVTHTGKQPQVLRELEGSDEGTQYGNDFTCIPANVTYRPELIAKPSVKGIQSAVVTGPPNEEIYVDEWGRIKIKFHWDLLGQEERTSCWVRVSQIWAGGFGGPETIFTPRIGQEVLVDFLDGDPDRPMVVGTAYTNLAGPPYNLPEHKTRSTIKTHTVKGEGYNELRFEDLKGQEEIYIHGQKDWNIEILNDKGQTIGHDERLDVKNDRTKTVGHDQKEDIKNDKTITVGKNHTESIGENMKVTIGKNFDESTGENKTVSVGKNSEETVADDAKINIGKNRTMSIGDNSVIDTGKDLTETIGKQHKLDVGDDSSVSVGKNLSVMVGQKTVFTSEDQITIKCGSSSIIMKSDGKIQIKGVDISIDASGKLVTKGQKITGN
jgi:type VI secretion system secreted protein VgrG